VVWELLVLFLLLFFLTISRENIGLSLGQFLQFWPIVLVLFLYQTVLSVPYEILMLFIH